MKNIIGGAGAYAVLGARLFVSPPKSESIGWIVDRGSDFPPSIQDTIDEWETTCLMRDTPDRLTTRALNTYGPNEYRGKISTDVNRTLSESIDFKYLTPKIRLDTDSLNPELLRSKSFHAVCSPSRIIDIVTRLKARREEECSSEGLPPPMIVWEPVPDLCSPDELINCFEAMKMVDVVSPNHVELASFFIETIGEGKPHIDSKHCDASAVEKYAKAFIDSGIGSSQQGAIVVRCGKEGCYIASREQALWLPAYHQDVSKVVDPTGAGNAFLGGLALALARGHRLKEACMDATVAASFAVEQVGMPTLSNRGKTEKWNGQNVSDRRTEFYVRLR